MKIFLINLDCRPERLAFVRAQLDNFGLEFTRISAVNGLNDPLVEMPEGLEKLSGPEVACYRSHLIAFEAFLKTDDLFALILEDDVLLSSNLPAALSYVEKCRPENCITRLEVPIQSLSGEPSRVDPRPYASNSRFRLTQVYSNVYGLGAYVIDRSIAKRVLKDFSEPQIPIDLLLLCDNKITTYRPKLLQFVPPVAIQNRYIDEDSNHPVNESDLEQGRQDRWAETFRFVEKKSEKTPDSQYLILRILQKAVRNFRMNLRDIFQVLSRIFKVAIINPFVSYVVKPIKKLFAKNTNTYEIFTFSKD